jgi:hypothetical protein
MITAEQYNLWIMALTNGQYKQGRYNLRKDGKYCCLGVLADLLGPEYWDGDLWKGNRTDLPYEVLSSDVQHILMNMNDHGVSFEEIATILMSNSMITKACVLVED